MKKSLIVAALAACGLSISAHAETGNGPLVIAGGALSSASTEVYQRFASFAGNEKAKIGIVPAATGSIQKKFDSLRQLFMAAGVPEENIILLPLAVKNDKKTKEVDESTWVTNGQSESIASQISELSGIWFVGGDQTLITKVLLQDNSADTPVLKAIREMHQKGGVIGGTSAGAAIMSEVMIAGGNSEGALLEGFKEDYQSMDEQEYGPVVASKGLGFFTDGIIDQHFDRKARLGRLIVTLLNQDKIDFAFGVDEGTAMLVEGKTITVVGQGGVTVVDKSKSESGAVPFPLAAQNIRLTYLQSGDSYNLSSHDYTPRKGSYGTVGHEYFNVPQQSVSGIMSANRNLDEFIGFNLVDNKAAAQVQSWVLSSQGKGLSLTFSQDTSTKGYWSQDITADIYSFENVRLDVTPIKVTITNLN